MSMMYKRLLEVEKLTDGVFHMTFLQAMRMFHLIRQFGLTDVLELGFSHGVGTCYLAACVESAGGSVVAIDLESAKELSPNIDELVAVCGVANVERYYEPTSYTWRLMKWIQDGQGPRFDLVYLDAAHDWFTDGFGFFLVDRLLRVGGWLVLDDLNWTFATSPSLRGSERVAAMPQEERDTAQVRLVYDLLVRQHPCYGEFRIFDDDWAMARKVADGGVHDVVVETRYEWPSVVLAARYVGRLLRGL